MKKLIFAMLLAFSSSLVMAQAPGRDPNNDPHKASSASYKPSSSSSANDKKPGSATAGVNKPGNSNSGSKSNNNLSKPNGNKPPMDGAGGPGGAKPSMNKPGNGPKPPMNKPGYGPKPPMNKPGYGPKPPMPPVNVRPVPPMGAPVSYAELESFLRYMNLISFDSRKLSEAKSFIKDKALSASQIALIADKLSFDSNRLSFAKYAFKYCVDPGDYYIVENKLSFSSSKRELRDYINRYY